MGDEVMSPGYLTRAKFLAIAIAVGGFLPACLGGVAVAAYRGTVTAGDRAGYSFDGTENPQQRSPIAGATVAAYAGDSNMTCPQELTDAAGSNGLAQTGAHGEFDVSIYYTGGIGLEPTLLVCVTHPDYKPFRYSAVVGESSDPRKGQRFLNVRLEPK
jgi:hypothetical protein